MSYYLYVIDAPGIRSDSVELGCSTDIDAMVHAGELIKPTFSVEIWDGFRFVGEIGQFLNRWSSGEIFEPSQASFYNQLQRVIKQHFDEKNIRIKMEASGSAMPSRLIEDKASGES